MFLNKYGLADPDLVDLVESDERLRQLERRWAQSNAPDDAAKWGHTAIQAGHSPLHVAHKLLSSDQKDAFHRVMQNTRGETQEILSTARDLHRYMQNLKKYHNAVRRIKQHNQKNPGGRLPTELNDLHSKSGRDLVVSRLDLGDSAAARAARIPRNRSRMANPLRIPEGPEKESHAIISDYILKWPHESDKEKLRALASWHGASDHSQVDQNTHRMYVGGRGEHLRSLRDQIKRHWPGSEISSPDMARYMNVRLGKW